MTLPNITNKQQEILKYLYHFRFLNRIQIQALLKHKDYKTIYLWLKDLTEKEYINRIYSTKFPDNTKPAIYYIGPNGLQFLKLAGCDKRVLAKMRRDSERESGFIDSCILLADIYLKERQNGSKVITKSAMANSKSPFNFLSESNIDLVIEKKKEGENKYVIVEILNDYLPVHMVKKRIKDYIDMYFSNEWEEHTDAGFPTIVLVCDTLPMVMAVKKLIRKLKYEFEEVSDFVQLIVLLKSEYKKYSF